MTTHAHDAEAATVPHTAALGEHPPATHHIRLPSGRQLAVRTLARGTTGARTVVLCHSAPGSATFDPDPSETARHDVTLLAVDRPGYGASDPVRGDAWASVPSAADDVAAAIDALGCGTVGVAGWSAGGRVALALAARRPDLVDRVAVIGTPAPDDAVPWIAREHVEAMNALRDLPPEMVHAVLVEQFAAMVPADPAAPEALGLLEAGEADERALAVEGARERLATMLAASFAQGAIGLAQDVAGYMLRPWGFEPAGVRAKTLLLHAAFDPVAPPPHGRWWQRELPVARSEVVPDAGHLLIVPMWHRVLSHVAPGTLRRAHHR